MTAPLTPRDNQPPDEPRHPEAAPADEHDDAAGPETARELREAVLIALLVAATGALLGLLWNWLAPHVPLVADTRNVYLKNTEGEESIGADGTFLLLAFGFGVLTTAAVFLFRRRGGIPLVVALVVGGLLGATLGWMTGMWLGPTADMAAHAKQVGPGVVFDGPLRLQAKGALLAWPIGAMLTQLVLTVFFGPPDPVPEVPYWLQGQQEQHVQQAQQGYEGQQGHEGEQGHPGQQAQHLQQAHRPEVPDRLRENHDQRPPAEG
ncbi:ABC transporter permease [Streptomyces sp. NPDC058773]|uniref:ABC transporter permease n=1 Tax=Streptomyces sp. NPDC058773 TaxID=3346632 RepID=UPI003698AA43